MRDLSSERYRYIYIYIERDRCLYICVFIFFLLFFFFLLPRFREMRVMCTQLKARYDVLANVYSCFFRQLNFLSYLHIAYLHLLSLCSCKHLFRSFLHILLFPLPPPLPLLLPFYLCCRFSPAIVQRILSSFLEHVQQSRCILNQRTPGFRMLS